MVFLVVMLWAQPSVLGDDVITYRWSGTAFVEIFSTHNEYSKAVGGSPTVTPAPVG